MFLSNFSQLKKSGRVAAHSSAELGAHLVHDERSSNGSPRCRYTWVDGNGDAWTMVNTVHARLVLAELGLDAHPVAPAVAALRCLRFDPGPVGCRGSTVTSERHNPARQSADPAK